VSASLTGRAKPVPRRPVNILYTPGRHTVRQLADLGVRRVSCGSLLFRAALHAAVQTALAVARDEPVAGDIPGYAEIQRLALFSGQSC